MKKILAVATIILLGMLAGSAAAISVIDYSIGDAAGGIGQSRHNLGSLGVHIIASETSQVCVFCHTPHFSNTDTQPLWNRVRLLGTGQGVFGAYGTTVAGTTVGFSDLGPTTLACLTCHDGTTALDMLVNRPGKDTKGGNLGWTFTEDGTIVSDWLTSGRRGGPGCSDRLAA